MIMSTHCVLDVTTKLSKPVQTQHDRLDVNRCSVKAFFCYLILPGYFWPRTQNQFANICQRQMMKNRLQYRNMKISNTMYMFIVYVWVLFPLEMSMECTTQKTKMKNKTTLHSFPLIYSIFFCIFIKQFYQKGKYNSFFTCETNSMANFFFYR